MFKIFIIFHIITLLLDISPKEISEIWTPFYKQYLYILINYSSKKLEGGNSPTVDHLEE